MTLRELLVLYVAVPPEGTPQEKLWEEASKLSELRHFRLETLNTRLPDNISLQALNMKKAWIDFETARYKRKMRQ